MDALSEDDVARSRATPPAVKLAQALAMMEAGFRLQRSKIARENPSAPEEELERLFRAWLQRDE